MFPPSGPLRIVSVSLGSSLRNHLAHAELLGRHWSIERIGVDGDLERARKLIAELDGQVAAIGLGGIDLYLFAGEKRYTLRDGKKLADAAQKTPVVDGSGLKNTLERSTIQKLEAGIFPLAGKTVALTCAVDRFGMAQELVKSGARVVFGDLLFILGINKPLDSLESVRKLGAMILPVATKLPFKLLYPTGEAQNVIVESNAHQKFFAGQDVIAGDFLLIRRHLPRDLTGQTLLTNTVTAADVELLRQRNCARLITTTPEFEGRSFGTNVMEGIFAALGDRTPEEYQKRLNELNWSPRIVDFESEKK